MVNEFAKGLLALISNPVSANTSKGIPANNIHFEILNIPKEEEIEAAADTAIQLSK